MNIKDISPAADPPMDYLAPRSHALEELPGVGKADHCQAAVYHAPKPLRFIWHHIQPLGAGGTTIPANLAQLCDSCHYSTHIMLWQIANGGLIVAHPNRAQLAIAQDGYQRCVAAGTTGRIPKEA